MDLKLSQEQVLLLWQIKKKERFNRQRFVKATVLLMIHRGLSVQGIQLSLSLDYNTIRRYVAAFNDRGLTAYFENGYIRYTGKLTAEQEIQLAEYLDANLYLGVKPVIVYVTKPEVRGQRIDRRWRLLRQEAINSIHYATYQEFSHGIIDFMDNTKKYRTAILSLLTLNFRTVNQRPDRYAQTTSLRVY